LRKTIFWRNGRSCGAGNATEKSLEKALTFAI